MKSSSDHLLNTAAMMVDGTYEDLYRALRPGIRENELTVIAVTKPYDLGFEDAILTTL